MKIIYEPGKPLHPEIEYMKDEFDQPMPVEAIKTIFAKAKNASRYRENNSQYDGYIEDTRIGSDLMCAMGAVGKQQLYDLKHEVYSYINDPCIDYRRLAVETLGWNTDLGLKDFQKNEAWDIWLNDPDDGVRVNALTAWANYYYAKKDPSALQKLYNIFSSENYSYKARAVALYDFMLVAHVKMYGADRWGALNLDELKDHEAITKAIDWEKVHAIMRENIPGWSNKSSG